MIYQQIEQSNTPELADFALPDFERKNTFNPVETIWTLVNRYYKIVF